ncbi:MAG: glycoside hydrolase family 2 TIM barrel-domain containing protein, partial [Clostridia bacterium]
HEGGYSTFRVDLTNLLKDENELCVKADNSINEKVYPQFADFTFYGGIYRDVNLIEVSNSHFDLDYFGADGVLVTPTIEGKDAKVQIQTFVTNKVDGQIISVILLDKENKVVAQKSDVSNELELKIENVHLWNGTIDPYLYKAVVELVENDIVLDNKEIKFGVRSFKVDPNLGFILNGKEYPLHGVSRHQDRAEIGGAITKAEHKEDVDLILEVGANTVRLAHYQHDQYFYDLCDEKGLVLWAEIPFISRFLPNAVENTVSQMKELISQNYNHTSIVCWGLSNEITIGGETKELLDNHYILNDLCHEMDKTRLTTMAHVSMMDPNSKMNTISDISSYNHYFGWYGGDVSDNAVWIDDYHAKFPDKPLGISEYGCEGILKWHSSKPEMGDYSEEYQAFYHEKMLETFSTRKFLWSTHVWNMFDFGSDMRNEGGVKGMNNKGLVTFDRKTRKDSFFVYKAYWSTEKFVHLCGKRFVDRVDKEIIVKVYSSLNSIDLYRNGKLLESQKGKYVFEFKVKLKRGENNFEARSGEFSDSMVINKVKKPNESYSLESVQKVEKWFDKEGNEINFKYPAGYYSVKDKISDVMKNPKGAEIMHNLIEEVGKSFGGGKESMELPKGMMKMMGSFTFERLAKMAGEKFSQEKLYEINCILNTIKKDK